MTSGNRTVKQTEQGMPAKILVGTEVVNPQGEHLGRLEDFMLDAESGRLIYGVLSFGGLTGMGDKLFAVPWLLLVHDARESRFVLKVDRERLKTAPGFDRQNWPRMTDRAWGREIHEFYALKPYWEEELRERRGERPGRRVTDHLH